MQLSDDCDERQENEPLVVVLDSMGGRQETAVKNILEYLSIEWNKNDIIKKTDAVFPFDSSEMAVLVPNCPKQPDSSSCGLYLIHNVDKIFENVDKFCTSRGYRNMNNWKNEKYMLSKRFEMATLLRCLSKDQGRFNNLVFPDIKFLHSASITGLQKESISGDSSARDLAFFNEYARQAVTKESNIALCREYKLEVTISKERRKKCKAMVICCRKDNLNPESFDMKVFNEYMKMNTKENPYTELEILSCVNEMEKEGLIMTSNDTMFFL